jgi:hypothetical protein
MRRHLDGCFLLLFLVLSAVIRYTASLPLSPEHLVAHRGIDRCNIPVLDTLSSFHSYFPHLPFILRSPTLVNNSHFTALTSPASLQSLLSSLNVTLASANTYSHARRVLPFSRYMQEMVAQPVSLQDDADSLWYWFGDHEEPTLDSAFASPLSSLLSAYSLPGFVYNLTSSPLPSFSPLSQPSSRWSARLSFGVGSAFSGTPPHFHSAVFAHLLHGSKRWWLAPPSPPASSPALVRPDMSAIQWVDAVYPLLQTEASSMQECLCRAGDVLYVPSLWLHATLNMQPATVFVSMFMADGGEDWREEETQWTPLTDALNTVSTLTAATAI